MGFYKYMKEEFKNILTKSPGIHVFIGEAL
jgi:hypothetical protein